MLIEHYGLDQAEPYYNETLNDYISDQDRGAVVAGDSTICAIAFSESTDDYYGRILLTFLDREYFES